MYEDKKIHGRYLLLGCEVEEIKQQSMEQGMEQGMEKGMEKGKLEIARNLLANGVPLDVITKSSGLPADKIQALAN
jgi:predicted transposase/invertase (TIGR01784 family)